MKISRTARLYRASSVAIAAALILSGPCAAQTGDSTHSGDAAAPAQKKGFLSSLGDSIKNANGSGTLVARGHFDANGQRYYCLVDTKTGEKQTNAIQGTPFQRPDGLTGVHRTAIALANCDRMEKSGQLVTEG